MNICRTACLGLGVVMALAFTTAFAGAMAFASAVVLGLLVATVSVLLMLRTICGSAGAGSGPLIGLRYQVDEAVFTPKADPVPGAPMTEAAPEKVTKAPGKKPAKSVAKKAKADKPKAVKTAKSKGDDLKRVKGLGPKFQKALAAEGIRTFAQLAALDDAALETLDEAHPGLRARALKGDWAGQARALAGNGAGE